MLKSILSMWKVIALWNPNGENLYKYIKLDSLDFHFYIKKMLDWEWFK
jgi:hypothetical protein